MSRHHCIADGCETGVPRLKTRLTEWGLEVRFEHSATLNLFLAIQRELSGRFAHEINYLPCPIVPEIAQFQSGIRMWKDRGLTQLPAWIVLATEPAGLVDIADDRLRPGARHVAGAMTAAEPVLREVLAGSRTMREEAEGDLRRLLPLKDINEAFREALGIGSGALTLPLYLVPLAPHYPGAGFLADGNDLVSAYVDCRRFTATTLADGVLTLLGWALLRVLPGRRNLLMELADRLPGSERDDRRVRALLSKILLEITAAHLVRGLEPRHRACVDILGTAWRFPRLFGAAERHWMPYLTGLCGRAEALSAVTCEISERGPQWYVDEVDASSLAADFYLLEWLASVGNVDARRRLAHWVPQLASYFAIQLDLIIGGELGHFERARDAKMADYIKAFILRTNCEDSRVAWHRTRLELGQSRALELAAEVFSGPGIEYGGDAWGPVAAILRRYVDHELPHTVFVDQCFTLEHNNGSLFDKFLATEDLLTVLNAQAAGDLDTLASHASEEARRLLRGHHDEQLVGYDPGWLGIQVGSLSPNQGAGPDSRCMALNVRSAPPGSLGCGSAQDPAARGNEGKSASRIGGGRRRPRKTVPLQDRQRYRGVIAKLYTTLGIIQVELWPDLAPYTVDNFVLLATGKRPWKDPVTGLDEVGRFYDGTLFHRRIPGFLIQGGDRTGTGQSGPGYRIPDEIRPDAKFDRPFLMAMANTGPNSAGSQFFITVAKAEHLSGAYCQFGAVVQLASRDVVCSIAAAKDDVQLESVRISTW